VPKNDNGEVVEHVFEVQLNALGKAFLMLDDYYRDGAAPSAHIEITEPTGETWDEEEFAQYLSSVGKTKRNDRNSRCVSIHT